MRPSQTIEVAIVRKLPSVGSLHFSPGCALIGRFAAIDYPSWHLGYLDVKSGAWLQNRSVLIPTRWVQSFSWADFRVNLHHTKTGI